LAPDRAAVEAFYAAALATTARPDFGCNITSTITAPSVGSRRSSHRGGLSCADQPDYRRYGMTASIACAQRGEKATSCGLKKIDGVFEAFEHSHPCDRSFFPGA
jgi:hypothetical protein